VASLLFPEDVNRAKRFQVKGIVFHFHCFPLRSQETAGPVRAEVGISDRMIEQLYMQGAGVRQFLLEREP
jgi:hypothetical protein